MSGKIRSGLLLFLMRGVYYGIFDENEVGLIFELLAFRLANGN